ncbi:LLM class flavin-dependent oxidoreductase [Kocuria arenosa]|uniref:LLM class flavin-dependent oxidoreductase n=1 Tax=Kocuria arenosa TaxID=3071446 RepID=UPI0034D3B259
MTRQLTLNAFVMPAGHHEAAWRHPAAQPERLTDIGYYQQIARHAEAAKLDAIFFADFPALGPSPQHNVNAVFEPITALAAIAAVTERIGLIATASTTYYEPYNLARLFASLDLISGGRAGWNIVTTASAAAAANFGLDAHPNPEQRYARAHEFVEAAIALWNSWDEDALVLDGAAGIYADPGRIHTADYTGTHIRTRGPLNVPRSPQGRPVLVQAGASNQGRFFAARFAEAIFTAHQQLADAQAFYTDIKDQARRQGRDPAHVKILPGISPFIADTEEKARALEQEFNELIVPAHGLAQLQGTTGVDLSGLALDTPVPLEAFPDTGDVTDNRASRPQVIAGIVRRERPTVRQLLHRLAGARGHRVVAGTPEQIADTIQEWFTQGAADGFNVMPPYYPGGLEDFTTTVVPILQERGLFRTDYTGTTLREHLGLPRPAHRGADQPVIEEPEQDLATV